MTTGLLEGLHPRVGGEADFGANSNLLLRERDSNYAWAGGRRRARQCDIRVTVLLVREAADAQPRLTRRRFAVESPSSRDQVTCRLPGRLAFARPAVGC